MSAPSPRPLTATVEIDAPVGVVWRVVSDVRRTGEWSPECRQVVPLGQVGVGTRLIGRNRRGMVQWATVSRITEFAPERAIEWIVPINRAIWGYELEPTATGTRLTHTRRTPRGESWLGLTFARWALGGVSGHDDELEAGMNAGLERIRVIAEREPAPAA